MADIELPMSPEAEESLLGSILIEGSSVMKLVDHIVTKEDFTDKKRVILYRALKTVWIRRGDVDFLTVTEFLQNKGVYDEVGAGSYIASLTADVPNVAHAVTYARIVADKATARRTIQAAQDIIKQAAKADDIDSFIDYSERRLKGVTRTNARNEGRLALVDLDEWRTIARESQPLDGEIRGLSLGWRKMDDITEGFEPGEVMILTGHTKHGKSKLAANMAWNVAAKGTNVLFVNTEMTKIQVARRMNGMSKLDEKLPGKIYLNDRADLQYRDVITIMEKAKELGCGMVIIDHLHFFGRSVDNQVNEISKITKEFKEAAVQLDLPVLLLCHIQQGDTRKKPTLQMLKGSSSIAQDADIVITVWRDDRPNAPDPHTTEVLRLAHRSAERAVTHMFLYADGIRLLEERPATTDQQRQYAEDTARRLGEKDDDDALNLESDWDEELENKPGKV
jgi:replicative DNA helicase